MSARHQWLGDGPVIRISLPWMLDVAASLDRLDQIDNANKRQDVFVPLLDAKYQIESLFNQSIYTQYLRISNQRAAELAQAIDTALGDFELEAEINSLMKYTVKTAKDRFKEVFFAEISNLPTFLVTRKAGYDISILIEAGTVLFPSNMLQKVPEAEADAIEAGKALAYELGTACGFHAFRVTESVVKRYWDWASGGKPRPNLETLGSYANEMEKNSYGDKKILESIKQLTKFHRNPIAHPEIILTVDNAIGILGMASSVIGAITAVLPDVQTTTGAPSPAAAP